MEIEGEMMSRIIGTFDVGYGKRGIVSVEYNRCSCCERWGNHEVKPVINFPYVIECLQRHGGCGFTTQPMPEPVNVCPKCGNNLEEVWNRKYKDELKATQARSGRRF